MKLNLLIAALLLSITSVMGQANLDRNGNPILGTSTSILDQPISEKVPTTTTTTAGSPLIVVHTVKTPGNALGEITFDGEYLWMSEFASNLIYKYSPVDGAVIKTIPVNIYRPYGLTFDGTHLWVADPDGGMISQLDTADGTVLQMIPTTQPFSTGLGWNGTDILSNQGDFDDCFSGLDSLYQYSVSGAILNRGLSPAFCPFGVAYDGNYIWSSDNGTDEIYKIDPLTYDVLDTIQAPGGTYPGGLAFDGQYLWVANNDQDSTYQIDIGITPVSTNDLLGESHEVSVYPNPSTGDFVFESNIKQNNANLMVSIYDAKGQKMFTQSLNQSGTTTIEMEAARVGMYFYTVSRQNEILDSGKLIKK